MEGSSEHNGVRNAVRMTNHRKITALVGNWQYFFCDKMYRNIQLEGQLASPQHSKLELGES